MKVFTFICVHAWETNTYARVNLYEMSTYKSSWSWSGMCLLRHGCQRNSFEIPRLTVKCTLSLTKIDKKLTIYPGINGFQIPLKTLSTGHRWRKAKDFIVFCSGKICLVLFQGCCSFVLRHLCPVHEINAQTPVTTILATHLLHEFIVNVKHRMD